MLHCLGTEYKINTIASFRVTAINRGIRRCLVWIWPRPRPMPLSAFPTSIEPPSPPSPPRRSRIFDSREQHRVTDGRTDADGASCNEHDTGIGPLEEEEEEDSTMHKRQEGQKQKEALPPSLSFLGRRVDDVTREPPQMKRERGNWTKWCSAC